MPYTFTRQSISEGLYEPEGIYLGAPFAESGRIVQPWGAHPDLYALNTYNGIPLRGYPGIAFHLSAHAKILSVDDGRVTEISYERGGFEKYVKVQHRWGESIYAFLTRIEVESGQAVQRGDLLGTATSGPNHDYTLLHFGIRVTPYNRFDGWGGFTDPLPYLPPEVVASDSPATTLEPIKLLDERPGMRRP